MRIEFETAMAKQLSSEGYTDFSIEMMFERGSDDEYRSIRVNGAYWGWQASRNSIEIDMPRSFSEDRYFRDVYEVEDVLSVIHSAGIRTK